MRALVLGGTRFVGRALVQHLLDEGHEVTLLHTGHHRPFDQGVEYLVADRKDHAALHRVLRGRHFEVVFEHAYVHPLGTAPEDVEAVLDALSAPPGRVVFTSSAAVYEVGSTGSDTLDESSPYATRGDLYSTHKIASERLLLAGHAAGRYEAVILRPSFIVGPFSPGERLGFFWDRMHAGRTILLPDHGETRLQFAYVHDVAKALRCAATLPSAAGRVFNLGYEEARTQRELVADLAEIAGLEVQVACVPRQRIFDAGGSPFDAPYYFAESLDISGLLGEFHLSTLRAARELPLTLTPWREALQATYDWYRQGPEKTLPLDTDFEDRLLVDVPTMALDRNDR